MSPRLLLFVLVAGACTPTERPVQPRAHEPIPPPDRVVPTAPATSTLTWVWVSPGPVGEPYPWAGDETEHPLGGSERVVAAVAADDDGLEVRREGGAVTWTTKLGDGLSNTGALASEPDAIFVAHYHRIATGTNLARIDPDDGKVVWDVDLYGVGPIGHSKYRNDVQVAVRDGDVVVYGFESGGAYVEVRDGESGVQLAHAPVDDALARAEWTWTGNPDEWTRAPVVFDLAGHGRARLSDGEVARLVFDDSDAAVDAVVLPRAEGELATGAGIVHDDRIYFVHASGISTGATLYTIDPRTGTIEHEHRLVGAGPIGHSEYYNMVQIAVVDERIHVYGNEAGARYVEVIDPATSETIVNKRWLGR